MGVKIWPESCRNVTGRRDVTSVSHLMFCLCSSVYGVAASERTMLVKCMITTGKLTCLQYMCRHNIRFSQLSNCGMWGNVSRHLTRGYNAEESIAWASPVCLFKISLHCCYLLCCTFSLGFQQTTTVDYVTDASLSYESFAIDTVLSLLGLNQLIGPLGDLLHLKKSYSSCGGVWNSNLSGVKCKKRLLHLHGEAVRDSVHWQTRVKAFTLQ